jgi:hypothetical protein
LPCQRRKRGEERRWEESEDIHNRTKRREGGKEGGKGGGKGRKEEKNGTKDGKHGMEGRGGSM